MSSILTSHTKTLIIEIINPQLWKGLQWSVGNGNAGGCSGVGGGSGVSGWLATVMVSAAVALAEAFALVVEAAAVGTVAV